MAKTVLITGATSGIGLATAKIFAENQYKLIVCGRREERLRKFVREYGDKTDVMYLAFDVRDKKAVFDKISSLPDEFFRIDILINNAGNAHGLDPFDEGSIADWDAMIDINLKGLLYVSKAVVPGMVERKNGHIINIGSISGIEVYGKGSVYCATKFAVDAISKGMRIDLHAKGIKVSEVKPGAVNTEFSTVRFKGDKQRADQFYEGFDPLVAEDIADIIWFIATRPKHVNIADLLVLPLAQAGASLIHREN